MAICKKRYQQHHYAYNGTFTTKCRKCATVNLHMILPPHVCDSSSIAVVCAKPVEYRWNCHCNLRQALMASLKQKALLLSKSWTYLNIWTSSQCEKESTLPKTLDCHSQCTTALSRSEQRLKGMPLSSAQKPSKLVAPSTRNSMRLFWPSSSKLALRVLTSTAVF